MISGRLESGNISSSPLYLSTPLKRRKRPKVFLSEGLTTPSAGGASDWKDGCSSSACCSGNLTRTVVARGSPFWHHRHLLVCRPPVCCRLVGVIDCRDHGTCGQTPVGPCDAEHGGNQGSQKQRHHRADSILDLMMMMMKKKVIAERVT